MIDRSKELGDETAAGPVRSRDARIFVAVLTLLSALAELSRWSANPVFRRDFINYWLAPKAAAAGVDPYDVDSFVAFAATLFPTIRPEQVNFTYPPHALFLFAPLAVLPPSAAFILWNGLSALLFLWAAKPFVPRSLPLAAVLLAPACLINFRFGQTGLLSAALFLIAFRPNGIAAALLTFKPQLGFLVAPAFVRDRRALAVAIVGTVALVGASALVFPGSWTRFGAHLAEFQGAKLASGAEQPWMYKATTPMIFYGLWGWLLFAIPAAVFLVRNFNLFTAATATFLLSPYGFHYDMAAVCLGFALLLLVHWESMPVAHRLAASAAYLSPLLVDLGSWLVPPLLLLGLAIQGRYPAPHTLGFRPALRQGAES